MSKIKKINGKYLELFDERTFDRLFQRKYGIKRDAFCKSVTEGKIVMRLGMSRKVTNPTEKAYTEILLKILFTSCRSLLEVNLISEIFDNWITWGKTAMLRMDIHEDNQTIDFLQIWLKIYVIKTKGSRLRY